MKNYRFWPHIEISVWVAFKSHELNDLNLKLKYYSLNEIQDRQFKISSEINDYLNCLDETHKSWHITTPTIGVIMVYCKDGSWLIPIKLKWGQ